MEGAGHCEASCSACIKRDEWKSAGGTQGILSEETEEERCAEKLCGMFRWIQDICMMRKIPRAYMRVNVDSLVVEEA